MTYAFRGEKFFLSCHYPQKMVYKGEEYETAEHCFQAQKCENKYEKEMIKRAKTPGEAKKLGKNVLLVDDWDRIKVAVMRDIQYVKFHIPELADKLRNTRNEFLAEENDHGDRFWGTYNGYGENHLGNILMDIRKLLWIERINKLENPLYDVWKKYGCEREDGYTFAMTFKSHTARNENVGLYSWAVPDDLALYEILNCNMPIVEIGAGTGYWASLLSQLGVDIVCYDHRPVENNNNSFHTLSKSYYPVNEGGPEKIKDHQDRALFLCWPPYDKPIAYECLSNYTGNRLIFIGESKGGCTGDSEFFNLLEKEWQVRSSYYGLPQWPGLHDELIIYDRA